MREKNTALSVRDCNFKDAAFRVNDQVLLMLLGMEISGDRLRDDSRSKATVRRKGLFGVVFHYYC